MKKKIVLITCVSVAIIAAVIAFALNAVFTVTNLNLQCVSSSKEGDLDCAKLKAELKEKFLGKNSTFLKLEDVQSTVDQYPALSVVSLKKSYPQTVKLVVQERKEAFAFQRENGTYAVLDSEGLFLYDKEENINRCGGENILLENFSFTTTEAGAAASGEYFEKVLALSKAFAERFGEARSNIKCISLDGRYGWGKFWQISMQEGVTCILLDLDNFSEEKIAAVVESYAALPQEKKLYGYLEIGNTSDETLQVSNHLEHSIVLDAPPERDD